MSLPDPLPFNEPRGKAITISALVFVTLSTFTVFARFYARRRTKSGFGADDWMIIPALIATYAETTILIMSERYGGAGHPMVNVPPENLVVLNKLTASSHFTFGTSLGFAKISICLLLIRIFFTRPFKRAAYVVMGYCICWTLMMIGIGAGLCRPFAYNWDKTLNGTCGNMEATFISIAATDIVGDVMIIILPLPWVWSLNTTRNNKIGLSFIFALGFLDIIVAILRIYYLQQLSFAPGFDFTLEASNTYIWTALEPNLAIIVASGALIRPLIRDVYVLISNSIRGLTRAGHSSAAGSSGQRTQYGRNLNNGRNGDYGMEPLAKRSHSDPSLDYEGGKDVESAVGIHVTRDFTVESVRIS